MCHVTTFRPTMVVPEFYNNIVIYHCVTIAYSIQYSNVLYGSVA